MSNRSERTFYDEAAKGTMALRFQILEASFLHVLPDILWRYLPAYTPRFPIRRHEVRGGQQWVHCSPREFGRQANYRCYRLSRLCYDPFWSRRGARLCVCLSRVLRLLTVTEWITIRSAYPRSLESQITMSMLLTPEWLPVNHKNQKIALGITEREEKR